MAYTDASVLELALVGAGNVRSIPVRAEPSASDAVETK